jgi:hypothetical protein
MWSHHAGERVATVVDCYRKVGVFRATSHANGIRDIKVDDIMRLHFVVNVGGLIHHAEHNPDKLGIVALLRNPQLDQLESSVFLYR